MGLFSNSLICLVKVKKIQSLKVISRSAVIPLSLDPIKP
jgi:hypothetical protein